MIEQIGIVGAGTMGNGIAQVCAAAGLPVVMTDISDAALTRRHVCRPNSLERLVNKQKMTDADRQAALARITTSTDTAKFSACDLVIEAATENEELKVKILKDLCTKLQPRALLATNTSSISITKLARRNRPSGPLHRHALLQSGAADGAVGIDPRPADLGRYRTPRRKLLQSGSARSRSRRRTARVLRSTASCAR